MPLLKYLPHEICKPKQPKSLPHEICKPTPAIRVYPTAPHEFFIPKPTVKPTTPPKPVTLIRARLWGLPPDRIKKKKKNFRFTILLHQIRSRDKRKLKTHHQSRRSRQQRRHHTTHRQSHHRQPPPTRRHHRSADLTYQLRPPPSRTTDSERRWVKLPLRRWLLRAPTSLFFCFPLFLASLDSVCNVSVWDVLLFCTSRF